MKQTIIIIALSLTIVALLLALVYKRHETHSNIFMDGAPVRIVKEPVSRKSLYSDYESTPIENACRISAFHGDTII